MAALLLGCAPAIKSTAPGPPTARQIAEFWQNVDPRSRELFYGVAGSRVQPDPAGVFEQKSIDTMGFSVTYDVEDESGVEWSVKLGDEAQSEVTASRLVWAIGYHQVPSTYVARWHLRNGDARRLMEGARFRPKLPTLASAGTWSWQQNPFVGTQAYRGLIVLMMILNSTDLKTDNNEIYERRDGDRVVGHWYVVKDLGATLGTTGKIDPKRNDINAFEQHGFVTGVRHGRVEFEYHGRHQELLERITPDDVAWVSRRLSRLTPAQWKDAFRAGGYDEDVASRYIRRIQQKIADGLALAGTRGRTGATS
jgi:hypothetical protein